MNSERPSLPLDLMQASERKQLTFSSAYKTEMENYINQLTK